jgi:methyl-accepting chemotaxis protein
MKNSFNLHKTTLALFFALFAAIAINVYFIIKHTGRLVQNQNQYLIISTAAYQANELRYEVAQIQQFLTDVSATGDRAGFKDAEAHYQSAQTLLTKLDLLQPQSKALIEASRNKLNDFYDTGKQMAEVYLTGGDEGGNYIMKRPEIGFDARAEALIKAMDRYIVPLQQQEVSLKNTITQGVSEFRNNSILRTILSGLAFVLILFLVGRKLVKFLGGEPVRVLEVANEVASGNMNSQLKLKAGDNSSVLAAVDRMLQSLRSSMDAANLRTQEALRIRTALDSLTISLRIADKNGDLIYLNPALTTLLKGLQDEMRKKAPDFDPQNLVGKSAGIFYDDPNAAVAALKNLRAERYTDTTIAGRSYTLVVSPIIDANGEQDGTVGQWIDKTDELRTEKEVSALVQAAAVGDLSHRIDLTDKTGFFLNLAQSVNQMVESTDGVITETVSALERIANGDMTQLIETEYQGAYGLIKDNANLTIQRLTDIVSEIKAIAHATNVSATEIAAGNIDLSQRTEEQASSLEETASSMEQMASTVKQNADNARQANLMATEASSVAMKGGQVVNKVVTTMAEINTSSKKIVDIISVIDGIAFQTNILALNAAVEAARAGEQGRGFAVVATEVRNLAQRSAAAAKEIKQLIGDSVDKVASGTKLVEQAGETMDEIVTAVKLVTDIVNEIAAASQEQSAGIDQVNNAITNMDEVTQQNAALVEEAAAAAASMEQQTQDLIDSVAVFKLLEEEEEVRPLLRRLSQPKAIASAKASPKKSSSKAIKPPHKEEDWEEF